MQKKIVPPKKVVNLGPPVRSKVEVAQDNMAKIRSDAMSKIKGAQDSRATRRAGAMKKITNARNRKK